MRFFRFQTAVLLASGVFCAAGARAQTDIEKPLPNVMLLVDSSGSMEYTAAPDEATGDFRYPECHPGDPTFVVDPKYDSSRWIDLLSVMTGSFVNYSCFAEDRSTSGFRNEFALPLVSTPYDFGYDAPYHRPLSNSCLIGPGMLPDPQHPFDFPDKAVNTFAFLPPSTVIRPPDLATYGGCPQWSQRSDGMLDIYRGRVRFGLMTFDSHPNGSTGVTSALTADNQGGTRGAWSYISSTTTNPLEGQPHLGWPPNCTDHNMPQEVGSRNAAAPPWEGRMVAFGNDNADPADAERRAEWIQQVLLSTRPYGATPLAGQMYDARDFLWNDASTDPVDGSGHFGPKDDALWIKDNCRKTVMIVLSDGEPNLDLRPFCEGPGAIPDNDGRCPFPQTPAQVAHDLANTSPRTVETYVIGFAMSDAHPRFKNNPTCDEILPPDSPPTVACESLLPNEGYCACNPDDRAIQACCTLNEIAMSGSPDGARKAFFPRNRQSLREVFNHILDSLPSVTTRTAPAFSNVAGAGPTKGMRFSSSFKPSVGGIWQGSLTRRQTLCTAGVAELQPVSDIAGDNFEANLNSQAGPPRRFFVPTGETQGITSRTLRPHVDPGANYYDGIDNHGATPDSALSATAVVGAISAADMNVAATDCSIGVSNAEACSDAILTWALGGINSEGEQRLSKLGGIYNSTPRIVSGPAQEFLRDEAYRSFATEMEDIQRSTVLYTSTVDGFLHAFKVAPYSATGDLVDTKENNELWAFVPPATLWEMKSEYPTTPAIVLDGAPVVADVPAMQVGTGTNAPILLQRTATVAQAGTGTYRTILVQGFGEGLVDGGYFALDITKPDLDTPGGGGGPKFLWQLTRDNGGKRLFGSGGTPLITNLAIKTGSGTSAVVVNTAVAILPGGKMGTPANAQEPAGPLGDVNDPTYVQRPYVRRYSNAAEGRSLTIVRLDTGEILRTFRTTESAAAIDPTKVELVTGGIPAPIVGQPAAYPTDTAAAADRIFVGDAEGRLWRVDVGDPDPTHWRMNVFFDALYGRAFDRGQPVETQPVLSTDTEGNVTVAFSTGSQRVQSSPNDTVNRVISLTDKFAGTGNTFVAHVNWTYTMGDCTDPTPPQEPTCPHDHLVAERVTGRMNLFGGVLYFATGIPGTTSPTVCSTQQYRLFGMDYVKPDLENDREKGGDEKLPESDTPPTLGTTPPPLVQFRPAQDGVVYGSAIQQAPSCFAEQTVPSDSYLGSGSRTLISAVNPGAYSLTFQIGNLTPQTGNVNAGGEAVVVQQTSLTPPRKVSRIASWASIFE